MWRLLYSIPNNAHESLSEWIEAHETLREILQIDEIPPYPPPNPPPEDNDASSEDPARQAAAALSSYMPFIPPSALQPPRMPDKKEMDAVILALHKRRLEEEVLG